MPAVASVRKRIWHSFWHGFLLCLALLLLNSMLTFHNVWPTPFVHWRGELSFELACALLLLVAWQRLRGVPPPALLATLAALFVLGTVGRYGEVTAPALYGREINLYWDLQHVASLAGMLTRVAPTWLLIALAIGIVALLTLLYVVAHRSLRGIARALQSPYLNAGIGIAAIAMIGWFTLQRLDERLARPPYFSIPVSQTYARQLTKLGDALDDRGAARRLPPSPAFTSTLSLSAGSDVMLVFLESYGRVTYDRPEISQALSSARGELDAALRETGRGIVSGYVESPTFGGGSWLAHLSFLSGIEVRDPGRYELLMTQSRRTFASEFARHGYRRVALMPGLKQNWPEGSFYDFDQIYGAEKLDYSGPAFGWWRIPDQFALAKLDALEIAPRTDAPPQPHQPLFTFFTTISTHTPFRPTPPYEADWSRLLGASPFDTAALQQSLQQSPEWNNMGASYAGAVSYSLQTLAGYLRTHRDRDFIMIVLGDHQPPAMVSGERASWDVPVHVIASNPALLAALQKCGFVAGLVPAPQTLGPMHQLAPMLLAAFEAASPCRGDI